LIVDLPFLIIFLIVIYYIGGIIVLVPLITIMIILFYTISLSGTIYKSIEQTYAASAKKNSILIETLNALESVKVFNGFNTTQYNYEEANGYVAKKSIKTKILSTSITTITGVLIQLNTVLVVIVGSYLIQEQNMTMGALIAVVILASRTISPIGQVASLISTYEQTKMAYKTLSEIMAKEIERDDAKEFIKLNEIKGDIEFRDVTFSYPNDSKESLKNVSFKIESNQRYAILGKIGSGKSTILKLVLGLYKPQSGNIFVDGIDINQIDPIFLRDNISYVPQDIVLFNGTIKENISYGYPYIDDEDVIQAAKLSNLSDYIQKTQKGFDTMIVEGGKNLSGGQRQSVAISRAFLRDKPIVLLDEPTNSMDAPNENIIKQNLQKKVENKTTLLITHKISMLDIVDKVIIIEDGKITFDGSKDEVQKRISNGR
ncbi:MAG: ATP-binding cassette domain-containing protein, partial [Campylobacterales bacterium]|nr:ATP-binding cassette domain-containing protein [Campylobacterales bacterium]